MTNNEMRAFKNGYEVCVCSIVQMHLMESMALRTTETNM